MESAMTYHGRIQNGQIVLDEAVTLPEGAAVIIQLSATARGRHDAAPAGQSRRELMQFAGIAKDLPPDASRNLDHYLYGHPIQ